MAYVTSISWALIFRGVERDLSLSGFTPLIGELNLIFFSTSLTNAPLSPYLL